MTRSEIFKRDFDEFISDEINIPIGIDGVDLEYDTSDIGINEVSWGESHYAHGWVGIHIEVGETPFLKSDYLDELFNEDDNVGSIGEYTQGRWNGRFVYTETDWNFSLSNFETESGDFSVFDKYGDFPPDTYDKDSNTDFNYYITDIKKVRDLLNIVKDLDPDEIERLNEESEDESWEDFCSENIDDKYTEWTSVEEIMKEFKEFIK